MNKHCKRILFAGSNSGCGKTTVTCAVLQALTNRGMKPAAFKCGPDYIDPMFHSRIIGAKSANLDPFFLDDNMIRYLLAKRAEPCDLSILEGVMGFYDGMGPTAKASSYDLSEITQTPVILIVNAKGMSLSALAIIEGFLNFYPHNQICGVILNQCSPMIYGTLAESIEKHFGKRVRPLGYLPKMPDCSLESRHLGLVTADEVADLKEKLSRLAQQTEKTIDLDGLLEIAALAPDLHYTEPQIPHYDKKVRIAVAKDRAFCFYYEDNLQLLREMGAELVEFSPLCDKALPQDIQGLYLGGGYPELYAEQLSQNESMRYSVRDSLRQGLPCIAECGGFMYLTQQIEGKPMVGFLQGGCEDKKKLIRFGYVTLTAKEDNLLCRKGDSIKAHEFHHWDADDSGNGFTAEKSTGKQWDCVHVSKTLYAGFPHFHFYSNLSFAAHFYEACQEVLQ